ncbi:MAG: S4 domain-containing protein, partial [Finegoldia magna]|nr:S4 domain-containing protein [Finegoldia magna]
MRIDVYLCENKFASSRTKAKALIENELVYYQGKLVKKPS